MNTNEEILERVEKKILTANNLDLTYINKMLARLNSTAIDFGDIYFEHVEAEGWRLDESIVKNGSFMITQGFGVRGVCGEKTAFAFSDEINERALHQTVRAARSISKLTGSGVANLVKGISYKSLYEPTNPITSLSKDRKTELLREIDTFARSLDSRVVKVNASISASYVHRLVASTDGVFAGDIKPGVSIHCSVIVEENGKRENGRGATGQAGSFYFLDEMVPVLPDDYIKDITDTTTITKFEKRYLAIAREAVRCALTNLKAVEAVACTMPVVLSSGWPAVLIHEAVGHGLEGDAIRKGTSIFAGKIGEKVASSICTIVDDGAIPRRSGSLNFDSEGTPTTKNVLIENGILKGYMYDKLNAKLMNTTSTGNGRRMSFKKLPIPRMTNTYLQAGDTDPKDIIASLDDGIYAVNFAGGQVDPTSGNFTFSANGAYLVKQGKIVHPVKGVTLIGNGLESMKKISMVGNNLDFDKGIGSCGKSGQYISVGIGQPTLRIEDVTIGGSK